MALDLDFFIGPASYLILGYYLSRKEINLSSNKIVLICIIAFIITSYYKIICGDYLYVNNNDPMHSLLNLSFPQIIQTSSVFLLFKYLYESSKGISGKIKNLLENDYINRFFLSVSRASYGIYLVHIILLWRIIYPAFENIKMSGTNTAICILIISCILLVVSWIAVLILSKIPVLNKISGYY